MSELSSNLGWLFVVSLPFLAMFMTSSQSFNRWGKPGALFGFSLLSIWVAFVCLSPLSGYRSNKDKGSSMNQQSYNAREVYIVQRLTRYRRRRSSSSWGSYGHK